MFCTKYQASFCSNNNNIIKILSDSVCLFVFNMTRKFLLQSIVYHVSRKKPAVKMYGMLLESVQYFVQVSYMI